MHKFDFRLEPVLKYRELVEEQAAAGKAKAQEEYHRHYEYLCRAKSDLANASLDNRALDPFDMFNRLAYCEYMTEEVKKREKVVNQSRRVLDQCRRNLIKAMQDRSVIEKLKDKHIKNQQLTVKHIEQKETDEVALKQYNQGKKRD